MMRAARFISGYGLTGPWRDKPAVEWSAQAASGLSDSYLGADHGQVRLEGTQADVGGRHAGIPVPARLTAGV